MQQRLPLPEIESRTGVAHPPPPARRIYTNRNTRLDRVEAVGFDMDYTLAIYRQDEMDKLSIDVTLQKLVERGYPEELLKIEYRTDFPVRGLLIDRKLGNILKMDRYRYVKTAYHGFHPLTREERRRAYHSRRLRPGTTRYHWVDTLYGLSEVAVYAATVEYFERSAKKVDFSKLFADIRECTDLSHQDDSILGVVYADLPRFVIKDPRLGQTMHMFRSAGKKTFLLTNSGPQYTEAMMSYLMDEALPEYPSWRQYFDLAITDARKPGFFTGRQPFLEVTESGTKPAKHLDRGRIYVNGNIGVLQKALGMPGDAVLYVGDHIYGDVLRAKKESAWRTAMIIQEMNAELRVQDEMAEQVRRTDALGELRIALQDELREHQSYLKKVERELDPRSNTRTGPGLEAERVKHRRAIDRLRTQLKDIEAEQEELTERVEQAFHPFWGSFFKAGGEVSSFGDQVEQYACLYTTRVSNFALYSPMHYFQSPRDRMPHEV